MIRIWWCAYLAGGVLLWRGFTTHKRRNDLSDYRIYVVDASTVIEQSERHTSLTVSVIEGANCVLIHLKVSPTCCGCGIMVFDIIMFGITSGLPVWWSLQRPIVIIKAETASIVLVQSVVKHHWPKQWVIECEMDRLHHDAARAWHWWITLLAPCWQFELNYGFVGDPVSVAVLASSPRLIITDPLPHSGCPLVVDLSGKCTWLLEAGSSTPSVAAGSYRMVLRVIQWLFHWYVVGNHKHTILAAVNPIDDSPAFETMVN